MVRWLMQARKDGRWGNTQENALRDGVARRLLPQVRIDDAELHRGRDARRRRKWRRAQFHGRSTEAKGTRRADDEAPARRRPAGTEQPLTFTRNGAGTLFYTARLRYAVDQLFQTGLDQGIRIERTYAPYVETGTRPAATTLQGRRSRSGSR